MLGVLQHRIPSVRRNNAKFDIGSCRDFGQVRKVHGTRMKTIDLVVVNIRDDHGLGRVGVVNCSHKLCRYSLRLHALDIRTTIQAHCGHGQWCTAKLFECVGNIARASPKIATQRRHQKRDIENVQLIRQDLLTEPTLEIHDGVEGQ